MVSGSQRASRWRLGPPALLLVLLTIAALGRVVGHPFVNLDDKQYVTQNETVLQGITLRGAAWAFTTFEAANWHPLTWLSHMLDVELFGLWAGGHHATSLMLHTAAAVLLFFVFAAMTGAMGRSFVVAALFAVHPLHVESVAWVAERKDVLAGLLFAAGLASWLGYARRPSAGRYLLALGVFALGCAAKPTLVTFPFVLLLLDWWPLGRLRPGARIGRAVLEKAPFLVFSAAAAAVTYAAQEAGRAVAAMGDLPLPWRLANALVSYVRYLGMTGWPSGLAVFYPHLGRSLPIWWGVVAGAALLVGTFALLRASRALPFLAAGWFWYLGMLVPVLGLVQVGNQSLADRYTYLPLIGIFVAFAWGARAAGQRLLVSPAVLATTGAAVLAALAAAAFAQAGHWRGYVPLYEHAMRVTRGNWFAEANLAHEDMRQKRWREAAERFRDVVRYRPDIPDFHFSLGVALINLEDYAGAQVALQRTLALKPRYAEAESNLAWIHAHEGRPDLANLHYRRALRLQPDLPPALAGLAAVLESQGRGGSEEALDLYLRAAAASPADAKSRFNFGAALGRAGRFAEAEREYRAAVALEPALAEARNNLGTILLRRGRLREALSELRAAVAAAPSDREMRANLETAEAALAGPGTESY